MVAFVESFQHNMEQVTSIESAIHPAQWRLAESNAHLRRLVTGTLQGWPQAKLVHCLMHLCFLIVILRALAQHQE